MVSMTSRCGQKQKIYFDSFQKLLAITMGQLGKKVYNLLEICEVGDLNIPTYRPIDAEEANEMMFAKS